MPPAPPPLAGAPATNLQVGGGGQPLSMCSVVIRVQVNVLKLNCNTKGLIHNGHLIPPSGIVKLKCQILY